MPGVTSDAGDESTQERIQREDRDAEEHGGIRAQFRRLKVRVKLTEEA